MSIIETGKTYDITVRRVALNTSDSFIRWAGPYGEWFRADLDSDTVTVAEVATEPPVGSIVIDTEGDYYLATGEGDGWALLIADSVSESNFTWAELNDPNDGLYPVDVVHRAVQR